jgi:hypothetical protein
VNVGLSTNGATGAFTPDGNVGNNKTVQVSGLTMSGSATNNYTLTQPVAIADITAKELTVTGITANNKTYNGTTAATLNTVGAVLVGNLDGVNVGLGTSGATGAFTPDGNVGNNKTVQVSGLTMSGSATNNYTLTQPVAIASIIAPPPTVNGFANGVPGFTFFGIPGSNYVVETTTNLVDTSSWRPVRTNTAGGDSSWPFTDADATNFVQRFYRVAP